MNKAELVAAIFESSNASRKDVEAIVDDVFDKIEECLVKGEEVKISNFGIFNRKARKARTGSNPSTHERINIKASATVSFKPSKALKAKVN